MPDKKERLDNIKNILENYEKNDNLNDTLKFIKRKFEEELEDYKYCENINNLEKGNHIKLIRDTVFDIDDISKEFTIVDKVEKDITNRGIDSSMTQEDIFQKYLKIKEIKPEDSEQYLKIIMNIVNSCEGSE